ncbi:unnamed protein product [Leptosia nina]|uniref:Carboxypeptidase n=1 Tax=Leptosia nina TaxID=320188 RepID=A0AAV1J7M5_9NEOP
MKVPALASVLLALCIFQVTLAEEVCGNCLILTPFVKNDSLVQARKLSEVNSSSFLDVKSYSGFITVKEEYDSNVFFWYFPFKSNVTTTPLIIWLQGGPGYSSLVGLFSIIGPFTIENNEVKKRPLSWAADYSLLFVDNPVGAGFSFTNDERGYPDNEDDVGDQLHIFLVQFFKLFPESKEAPLFVIGESYAGKYVPALSIQIHKRQDKYPINLKGLAIGNGLVDPLSMMHYTEFSRTLGLLGQNELEVLKAIEDSTVEAIQDERMLDAALGFNKTLEYLKKHSGVNIYNFNQEPGKGAVPIDFEDFVKTDKVRELIHVGNASFDLNNQMVYEKMQPDMMNTTKPFVEELLEYYGVMCYSGQLDVILPYGLSVNLYENLTWSMKNEYQEAPRRRLRSATDRRIVAFKKSGGNFMDVLVRQAGHAVPIDQPEVAKFIVDRFIDEYK